MALYSLQEAAQEVVEMWSHVDLDVMTARDWRELGDKIFWLEEALNG